MKIRILCVLLLAGCSSTSPVIQVGQDKYMVGSSMAGGVITWAEVKQLALNEATNHCASLGQEMTTFEIETHGARGWSPLEAEVTFECGQSGD